MLHECNYLKNENSSPNNIDFFFGRMSQATSSCRIQGLCGDDMEFYLIIKDDIIEDVKYFTEKGCCNTRIAGRSVARKVIGKNIYDAISVNPSDIIKEEKGLTQEGHHCAILAVSTFYRSIATYWLKLRS
jgi:NifU-like protein involved in Fe-S cluster formation